MERPCGRRRWKRLRVAPDSVVQEMDARAGRDDHSEARLSNEDQTLHAPRSLLRTQSVEADMKTDEDVVRSAIAVSSDDHGEEHGEGRDDGLGARLAARPERALIIHPKWLKLILEGKKTIEIRSRLHRCEGLIYLMESRTGMVRGTAMLQKAFPMTAEMKAEHKEELAFLSYDSPVAWPLTDVQCLGQAWKMPSEARKHCVTWIPRRRWETLLAQTGRRTG